MPRGRKFNKTNITRPSKGGGKKLKRQRDQAKRLVALGVEQEVVDGMNPREIRTKLKYPKKVEQEVAAAKG